MGSQFRDFFSRNDMSFEELVHRHLDEAKRDFPENGCGEPRIAASDSFRSIEVSEDFNRGLSVRGTRNNLLTLFDDLEGDLEETSGNLGDARSGSLGKNGETVVYVQM